MHPKISPWFNFIQKYGLPNVMWTEKIRNGIIATPVNTLTNIFYIFCGFIILFDTQKLLFKIYGYQLIFLGLMSGLYHASVSLPFQICDFLGMQFIISTILTTHLKLSYLDMFKINLLFFFLIILFIKKQLPMQLLTLISIILIVKTAPIYNRDFYKVLVSLTFGELFSILDLNRLITGPTSIIQGHAIWHLLSSISLLQWYFYIKKLNFFILKLKFLKQIQLNNQLNYIMGANDSILVIRCLKNGKVTFATLWTQSKENFEEYAYFIWRLSLDTNLKDFRFYNKYDVAFDKATMWNTERITEYGVNFIDYTSDQSNLGVSFSKRKLQLTKEQWLSIVKYETGYY
jgi:hypothetical protein